MMTDEDYDKRDKTVRAHIKKLKEEDPNYKRSKAKVETSENFKLHSKRVKMSNHTRNE
jgi:hypothetical protein